MEDKDVKGFLRELAELTDKYKIKIWGCDCCGSPCLMDAEYKGIYTVNSSNEMLEYKTPKKRNIGLPC